MNYSLKSIALILSVIFAGVSLNAEEQVTKEDAQKLLEKQQIFFIENQGQIKDTRGNVRDDIRYYTKGKGLDIYFRDEGVSYVLYKKTELENGKMNTTAHRIDLRFGENPGKYTVIAEDKNITTFSYIKGQSNHIENVPSYKKVIYDEVYEGIDVVYYPSGQSIKYDIIVEPGADPDNIKLVYEGHEGIEQVSGRELSINTSLGTLTEEMPSTYQMLKDVKTEIHTDYKVSENTVSFDVGEYEKDKRLIIDPLLYWSTFIGSNGDEIVGRYPSSYNNELPPISELPLYFAGGGIWIDDNDDIYIVGSTNSTDFPWDDFQGNSTTDWDIFIQKYNADGTLVYSDYVGDDEDDFGLDIELDDNKDPYIIGATNSPNIYTSRSPYDTTQQNGELDIYIYRHTSSFKIARCISGTDDDFGRGLTFERDDSQGTTGNLFIIGDTKSSDMELEQALNIDYVFDGDSEAYVAKVGATNLALPWAAFFGGDGDEIGRDIVFNRYDPSNHEVLIVGATDSDSDFPLKNAFQDTLNKNSSNPINMDGFYASIDASNISINFSTYFGGDDTDYISSINLVDQETAVMCGFTKSDILEDFDFLPAYNGDLYDNGGTNDNGDGFIALMGFNDTFGSPLQSAYIGGSSTDIVTDVYHNPENDRIYATGFTESDDFEMLLNYEEFNRGASTGKFDVIQACYEMDFRTLNSTYFGGTGDDFGMATVSSSNLRPTIYGETVFDFIGNMEGKDGNDVTHNGLIDAFLATFHSENDEEVNKWGTFFGGTLADSIHSVVVDRDDFVYVTGQTFSPDTAPYNFPVTYGTNLADSTHNMNADIFVAKFSRYGDLIWCTYIGSEYDDVGYDIDIYDVYSPENRHIYITGYTESPNLGDSATAIGENGLFYGSQEAFILRLKNDGSEVEYFSNLGATDQTIKDVGTAIDIDQNTGYIYSTGHINSTDAGTSWCGSSNCNDYGVYGNIGEGTLGDDGTKAFIAKWNDDLTLSWITWFGYDKNNYSYDIDYNETEKKVAICGYTFSVTGGGELPDSLTNYGYTIKTIPSSTGLTTNWVIVVDSNSTPYFASYIDGDNNQTDYAGKLAWDEENNNIYIAGVTANVRHDLSLGLDPQSTKECSNGFIEETDIFVIKLTEDATDRYGTDNGWYTLLGDCESSKVTDLKYRDGNVYVSGSTFEDLQIGGDYGISTSKYNSTSIEEGFLIELNGYNLDRINKFGTYISNSTGTPSNLISTGFDFQRDGKIVLVSSTDYSEMDDYNPTNAFQQSLAGDVDGLISRIIDDGTTLEHGKKGIQEINFAKTEVFINLFPNPSSKGINIQISDGSKVDKARIIDITGREIINTEGESFINIETLNAGSYVLTVTDEENKRYTTSFIKR